MIAWIMMYTIYYYLQCPSPYTTYLGIIIIWQQSFTDGHQEPESILFPAENHQYTGHYVHCLKFKQLTVGPIKEKI